MISIKMQKIFTDKNGTPPRECTQKNIVFFFMKRHNLKNILTLQF